MELAEIGANLSTRWRLMATFTHRPLYPQKKSPRTGLDSSLSYVLKDGADENATSNKGVLVTPKFFPINN
jgi:hypothetical protein